MTLSVRNNFFRGGIILAALSLGLAAAGGYIALSGFPQAAASAALRSRGIVQTLTMESFAASAYVPFFTILGSAVYALVSIILIYYFFEKTQSPEIFFFAFFVISMSVECVRVLLPLRTVSSLPAMYLLPASKALLFSRYFGLLSLFAASVHAAGLDVQKQQTVFLMLVLASLVITLPIPIDSLVWDSSLVMWNGYDSMLRMVGTGILAITLLTYFISAYTRGSGNYAAVGTGSFLALIGRNVMLHSDTWTSSIPGFFALILGTWLVCSRLRREYLWL